MARLSTDPTTATPDADLLEQRRAVSRGPLTATPAERRALDAGLLRADEGDVVEQFTPVPDDDGDDYPGARLAGNTGAV